MRKGKKYFRFTVILIVMAMISGIIGACEKDEGKLAQTTVALTTAKTAQVKTAVATSAKAETLLPEAATSTVGTETDTTNEVAVEEPKKELDGKVTEEEIAIEKVSEELIDLKGREIKVVYQVDEAGQLPSDKWETRAGVVRYKLFQEAQVKFNCKFVFTLASWATINTEFPSAVMAGVHYADVIRLQRANVPLYEKSNILLSLNDYFDFEKPLYKMYDQVNGVIYPDRVYAFFNGTPLTPVGVWFNRDVLQREGIPDLLYYKEKGIWDWNNFIDIAIKATRDIDGNGIIDQWGLGSVNAQYVSLFLMYSNLATLVEWSAERGYHYNLNSPVALKALQFVSDLYNTYRVIPNKNAELDFRNGKVAMFLREAWYGTNWHNFGMRELGMMELPWGPDNKGGYFIREPGSHFYFFPINITDPEGVVKATAYWNVIWDENKSDYVTMEDMALSMAQGYFDRQSDIDYYMNIMKTYRLKYDYNSYFSGLKTIATTNVFNKITTDTTAASAVEAIREQCQNSINELLEK